MNINTVFIGGRLGANPEHSITSGGTDVTKLSIATSEKWTDKAGEPQERTEWHSVSVFGKTAQLAAQYLSKGSIAIVEGRIQTDKWEDEQGNQKRFTKIIAHRVHFGPRNDVPQSLDDDTSDIPF
jgi:single-strand DNA-binding protein